MKKIILTLSLLFGFAVNSQNLSSAGSSDEAVKKAVELVNNTNNLKYAASEFFKEENKFVVKFQNGSDFLLVLFNYIKNDTSEEYIFLRTSGNYENITAIWQNRFSKDKKSEFFDKQNKIVYHYSEANDDKWIISR